MVSNNENVFARDLSFDKNIHINSDQRCHKLDLLVATFLILTDQKFINL